MVDSIIKIMWPGPRSGAIVVIRSPGNAIHAPVFISVLETSRVRPVGGPIRVSGVAQCNKMRKNDI